MSSYTPTDITRWLDEATELICITLRGPFGSYNGYAGVTKEHPLFGKGYDDCLLPTAKLRGSRPDDLNLGEYFKNRLAKQLVCEVSSWCGHALEDKIVVHGGITFSGYLWGEPEDRWYFGFDTAHAGDYAPDLPSIFQGEFRSKMYVENEVRKLAVQLYDFSLVQFLEEVETNASTE